MLLLLDSSATISAFIDVVDEDDFVSFGFELIDEYNSDHQLKQEI